MCVCCNYAFNYSDHGKRLFGGQRETPRGCISKVETSSGSAPVYINCPVRSFWLVNQKPYRAYAILIHYRRQYQRHDNDKSLRATDGAIENFQRLAHIKCSNGSCGRVLRWLSRGPARCYYRSRNRKFLWCWRGRILCPVHG